MRSCSRSSRCARTRTRRESRKPPQCGGRGTSSSRTAPAARQSVLRARPGRRAAALRRGPGGESAAERPRPEVRLGLRRRHAADLALDPDLPSEWPPVEEERGVQVRRQLVALAALVARVEAKPVSPASFKSTIRTDGRPSGAAVASAIASGVSTPAAPASREPALELLEWVRGEVLRVHPPTLFGYPPAAMATTKTIEIRTAIPGPRSAAILERKSRVIANAKSIVLPIVAQEARGATITDVDGNVFIDFTGGVGCVQPRARASARRRGGDGANRPFHPHRLHRRPVRAVCRARGAPARPGAVHGARQGDHFFNAGTRRSRMRSSSRGSRPAAPR